jgi:uncharacterized membrane protein HdeD (DUF308 family)
MSSDHAVIFRVLPERTNEEDRMSKSKRRWIGALMIVAGVVLAAAGVMLGWGLGAVAGVGLIVGGAVQTTDHVRPVRLYDHAQDGH